MTVLTEETFVKAGYQLEPGPVPMHHQVYLHLRGMLDDGDLRTGDRLPGERRLCQVYDCSLVTMRRALDELTRERRVVRMPGRGTFVTGQPLDRNLAALDSFTHEMRALGREPFTRLLTTGRIDATVDIGDALWLDSGASTIYLERLRLVDGEPLMLETVHLEADRFPGLLDDDLENTSLYEILASRYRVRLAHAEETIEPVALSTREAELLHDKRGRPALLLRLVAFDHLGVPVEYCRGLMRRDRARYHVDARGSGLQIF
jgi:GntR family transcriptional regulator